MQSGTGTQGFTNSTTVQIQVSASDAGSCYPINVELTNDGVNWVSGTSLSAPVSPATVTTATVSWQVATGDGVKGMYIRFSDSKKNCCGGPDNGHTQYWELDFTLDQTRPSPTPANLRTTTCSISGSTRTATMTWDASGDANFVGYRVYRSVASGAFSAVGITASQSFSDQTSKGDLVQYKVRAYDKAGNETADSNVLVYQKSTGGTCV